MVNKFIEMGPLVLSKQKKEEKERLKNKIDNSGIERGESINYDETVNSLFNKEEKEEKEKDK